MPNSEIVESFLQEAEEVLRGLEHGMAQLHQTAAWGSEGDGSYMGQVSILAHRIRGSAALYGYPQLSTLAGLLERLLDSRPVLEGELSEKFAALLVTLTRALRTGLDTLHQGGSDRELGLLFTNMGGSRQLQELVRVAPDAFRMRAPLHQAQRGEDSAKAPATDAAAAAPGQEVSGQEVPGQELGGTEAELRDFAVQNPEIWDYFAPEVQEHLASLREQLQKPEQADAHTMFRAAHTIKGSAYMVGLQPLGDFAHHIEDLLGAVREDAVGLSGEVLGTLESSLDLLDDMLAVAGGTPLPLAGRVAHTGEQLRLLASGQEVAPHVSALPVTAPAAPETVPLNTTVRVPGQRLESLMEQVSKLIDSRSKITRLLSRMDELQSGMQASQQRFQRTVRDFEERYLNPDMVRGNADESEAMMAGTAGITQQFAELEFDTYDDLNILSRSITELSADFGEVRRRLSDTVAQLNDENETLGKLVRELRLDLNQTSRVPFSQASGRLRRWARDRQENFDLNIEGEDVLIESTALQRIVDPLTHLLTNAVYHGLKTPELRTAAGKPARGQVWVRAAEQQNFLEITVADDGEGLNLEAIREKVLEKGLRSAQELNEMPGGELARLILLPGLSTAPAVGQVAGRGVGMDVVATTVRQLGGELLIQSDAGIGTAFTLRLPTSQRIMDVLEVQVGPDQWAAFPVNSIRALRDLAPSELLPVTGSGQAQGGLQMLFEGQPVPVVSAHELWGWTPTPGATAQVVVLTTISGLVAVRVEAFGRIEEVSVTPPGPVLSRLEYLSGTTVSASGAVLPVLDPAGLQRLSSRPDAWLRVARTAAQPAAAAGRILLVDDSLSVRRLVSRMLERGGYEVETANDGQEALDRVQLEDGRFVAIVTDLEMPRMNGYELLTAIRNRPASATLPVMIMTTRAGEKHQQVAFQLGANDYFTKPVNEALLLRRMSQLLGSPEILA